LKTKIFLLMFTFIIVSLFALDSYIRNISINMPYPSLYEYLYTPKQIFPCPDGGIIILGDCLAHWGDPLDPYENKDSGAIKLDDDGNCEWQWWSGNFLSWNYPTTIIGIDQEPDGRVNFIINNFHYEQGIIYNRLGWIDPQGNSSLQDITMPYCELSAACRLPNNDIFAIGQKGVHIPTYHTNAFFLRLSAQGDTLSISSIPPDSISTWLPGFDWRAKAFDLELDIDGMPVVTCEFTNRGASVVKTDWNGTVIWRRDTNYRTLQMPVPITKISETNEIVFGYQAFNNQLFNHYSIYQITSTGIDSLYTIQMTIGECFGFYDSMIGYSQGIYLAGSYGDGGPGITGQNIHISDYSLSGQNNWDWSWQPYPYFAENYYPSPPTDCIAILPDSTLIHAFGCDWGNYGLTVVKLLPNGTSLDDSVLPKPILDVSAYPNPFNSSTTVSFSIPKTSKCELVVYNTKGQAVKHLVKETKDRGIYNFIWNSDDDNGKRVSSGVYFFRLNVDGKPITQKMLLLK